MLIDMAFITFTRWQISLEKFSREFLDGHHVMRHQEGIWNGIWSDMFIESTFMRYGHGPGGIIGITLNPKSLKRWALSLHLCSTVKQDLLEIVNGDSIRQVTKHKEEGISRITADGLDRTKIREKIQTCIDPFDSETQSKDIINIVTGQVADKRVNIDKSVAIGNEMMSKFYESWPEGFNKTISKPVITMAVSKKHLKVDKVTLYDPTVIYSRILRLQNARDINIKDALKFELAPIPPSIFDEKTGEMRLIPSKSSLKSQLQVEIPWVSNSCFDTVILDGCALLWVVS